MDLHGEITEIPTLRGTISEAATMSGTISEIPSFSGVISGSFIEDYNRAKNKPQIESVELKGNKTFEDLGLNSITNSEVEALFDL